MSPRIEKVLTPSEAWDILHREAVFSRGLEQNFSGPIFKELLEIHRADLCLKHY